MMASLLPVAIWAFTMDAAATTRIPISEPVACEWTDVVVLGTLHWGAFTRKHDEFGGLVTTWLPCSAPGFPGQLVAGIQAAHAAG